MGQEKVKFTPEFPFDPTRGLPGLCRLGGRQDRPATLPAKFEVQGLLQRETGIERMSTFGTLGDVSGPTGCSPSAGVPMRRGASFEARSRSVPPASQAPPQVRRCLTALIHSRSDGAGAVPSGRCGRRRLRAFDAGRLRWADRCGPGPAARARKRPRRREPARLSRA